jgi:hypothetical protein
LIGDWEGEGGLDAAFSHSRTTDYAVTIEAHADGSWSYDEVTTLRMKEFAEPFLHTDHNRLHRVG